MSLWLFLMIGLGGAWLWAAFADDLVVFVSPFVMLLWLLALIYSVMVAG
jgi:hypothetical protein